MNSQTLPASRVRSSDISNSRQPFMRKTIMKNRTLLLTIGSALILSACGGGGGGGGSSNGGAVGTTPGTPTTPSNPNTPAPPVSTLSTITAANAVAVASNAYAATASISDSSSLTDVLTGVSIQPVNNGLVPTVFKLVRHAFDGPNLLTGVVQSKNCTSGGTIAIDATLKNPTMLGNGDVMTMTATNCVENGATLNGTLKVTFSNVTGDVLNSSTWTATLDSVFTDLAVASTANNVTNVVSVGGDMKIAMNQENASRNTVTITGKSLQTTAKQNGTTVTTRTLADYSLNGTTRDGVTTASGVKFSLSGNTTSLGQFSFTSQNTADFVSAIGKNARSGAMIVNGNASSVTLTAINDSSVRVDFSAKGDGTVTQSFTLSWAEFLSKI